MRNIDGQTGWNLYTPLISLAGIDYSDLKEKQTKTLAQV